MDRFIGAAVAALLLATPTFAQAGGISEQEVIVVGSYPGPVNPLARGAIYNTPPSVTLYAEFDGYRRHARWRGRVIRARY